MLCLKFNPTLAALAAVALIVGVAGPVRAAGTQQNTLVSNLASIDYVVGGINQTDIESAPGGNSTPGVGLGTNTDFRVDRVIRMVVSEANATYTTVNPGQTAQALGYNVQNTSNDTIDLNLSESLQVGGADPFGGTDNIDIVTAVTYYEDDGDAIFNVADTLVTYLDEMGEDVTRLVWLVHDIPLTVSDADISVHRLIATGREGGGVGVLGAALVEDAGADDPATVQTVFGDTAGVDDAARDAAHSDDDAYQVASASLTVTKASVVVSDPFNGAVNPKAIPGAIIRYTITVVNTGAVDATNVVITDNLSAELGGATPTMVFNTETYAPAVDEGIRLVNGAVTTDYTTAVDIDNGELSVGFVLTVDTFTITAGETATLTFELTIQ